MSRFQPPPPDPSQPWRAATGTAAWQLKIDAVTEGAPRQRRTWTGIAEIADVLAIVADGRLDVGVTTGRHFLRQEGKALSMDTRGVEAFGATSVALTDDDAGQPVLAVSAATARFWLDPDVLVYLPSSTGDEDGVFVLTVADAPKPAPGATLPPSAFLVDGETPEAWPRWVAGGLVFACSDAILTAHVTTAPEKTWNDFPALVRWVSHLIGTPAARTTEQTLDSPDAVARLQAALQAARGSTARPGKSPTQSDVDAICREAIALGVLPTVKLIIGVAGGSPVTINPQLRRYFERAVTEGLLPGAAAAPTPAVPEVLINLWNGVKAAAERMADAALAPDRERVVAAEKQLTEDRAALDKAVADLEAARRRDEAANVQRERFLTDLQERLAATTARLDSAAQAEIGYQLELAGLRGDRDAYTQSAATERDRANAAEADCAALRQQLADTTRMVDQLTAARRADGERIEALVADGVLQRTATDQARAQHQTAVTRMAQVEAELQAAQRAADHAHGEVVAQRKELSLRDQSIGVLEGQLLAKDDERSRLTEQLQATAPLPARIAELTAQLAAVVAERDQLAKAAPRHGAKPGKTPR